MSSVYLLLASLGEQQLFSPRKGTKAYEVAKSYKSQIDVYGSVRHRYKEGGDPVPDPASVIQAGYISGTLATR